MRALRSGTARRALLWLVVVLPLLFNPYTNTPSEPIKVSVFRWAVFGILVLTLLERRGSLRLIGKSLFSPRALTIELAVAVYGVALVLSTVFSLDRSLSFWGGSDKHGLLTWLAVWILFGIIISSGRDPAWIRALVDAVLVSTVPVCLYALAQFAGLDPLEWVTDSVSEMTSTLGRSNTVGAYIAATAPFALLRLRDSCKEGRSALSSGRALALVALQVSVVLLSQARAAWLGLIAGTAVFAVVVGRPRPSRRRRWLAAGLSAGVLVAALLSVVDLSSLRSSVSSDALASFGAKRLQTLESRWMIWRETLALVPENPLLGYGPETFSTVFHAPEDSMPVNDPHNVLLEHLVATGAIGLGAFCLLFAVFARQVKQGLAESRDDHDAAVLAALAGSATAYLVQALFNPDTIVLHLIFWLDLGLVASPTGTVSVPDA
ncbi:MAG TPA: O-antigen ligase family protein [Vicinamibacteria bacterium]|nr:O-antigen ligase family protein [Vicinamibacteria bacterium]